MPPRARAAVRVSAPSVTLVDLSSPEDSRILCFSASATGSGAVLPHLRLLLPSRTRLLGEFLGLMGFRGSLEQIHGVLSSDEVSVSLTALSASVLLFLFVVVLLHPELGAQGARGRSLPEGEG